MIDKELRTGWMTFEEIEPYREQLIAMEYRLMTKYHYPDRGIPESYPRSRVEQLKNYLKNGNTFFWGATSEEDGLVGYYWAYVSDFINKPRWNLRSLMIDEKYQRLGLGRLAMEAGLKKAEEIGCYDAATEYVPDNDGAAKLYARMGYAVSRIEVVRQIKQRD